MDYHARSRGHKAKEVFTCKKCDVLVDSKEDLHQHRKVDWSSTRNFLHLGKSVIFVRFGSMYLRNF